MDTQAEGAARARQLVAVRQCLRPESAPSAQPARLPPSPHAHTRTARSTAAGFPNARGHARNGQPVHRPCSLALLDPSPAGFLASQGAHAERERSRMVWLTLAGNGIDLSRCHHVSAAADSDRRRESGDDLHRVLHDTAAH